MAMYVRVLLMASRTMLIGELLSAKEKAPRYVADRRFCNESSLVGKILSAFSGLKSTSNDLKDERIIKYF